MPGVWDRAMPEFLIPIIADIGVAIGGSTGAFLIMEAGFVASATVLIGGLALSYSQANRAKRQARDAFNASQVDRLVSVSSSVTPRELVLGRVRKGGGIFFRGSTGANKTVFAMVITLAAHEIDAVEAVYFNDVPVAFDVSGNVTTAPYQTSTTESAANTGTGASQNLLGIPLPGTLNTYAGTPGPDGNLTSYVASGPGYDGTGIAVTTVAGSTISYQYTKVASNANIRFVMGTDTQSADARLMALFPADWTPAHRARGIAYMVCEFTYSETSFPSGLPNVTVLLRGAKVYDPRQNLIPYSEQFDNASWLKGAVVVADQIAAPDGVTSADKINESALVDVHNVYRTYSTLAGTVYTVSIYAKAAERSVIDLSFATSGVTDGGHAYFDLSAGVVGAIVNVGTTTGTTSSMQALPDGWYRCSITVTPATTAVRYPGFVVCATQSVAARLGTAGSGLYAWGTQLVLGSAPGAYCRTTGTPLAPFVAWSENPALLVRHVYQHASFGKATISASEDDQFITAANACDRSASYVVAGATTVAALFRAALVAPWGTPAKDLFDDLCQAMAGSWAYAGGQLYLKPGVYSPSVMSLTDADLAGVTRTGTSEETHPIAISVHRERAAKFNVVNIQMWDAGQDYKQVALAPVTDASLVTRDGATLAQAVTMSAVGFAPQAQHIANVMLREARDPLTVSMPFKLRAYPVELFDTVDLTLARYGWASKLFMVVGREYASDGLLSLTLKETASANYALNSSFSAQGFASNTRLPSPWIVATPGPITVTSGTSDLQLMADGTIASRMRVSWPAIDDSAVTDSGTIEVQYRSVVSVGEWSRIEVAGNITQVLVSDVQDANAYTVRARSRNKIAVGNWGAQIVHMVVGKSAAPSDVSTFTLDGLRLNWTPVTDADLAGYEVRFQYGTNTWWESAAKLHQGFLTGSPYTLSQRPQGTVTLLLKAIDTSGNYSQNATAIVANLGNILAQNLYLSYPEAPLFSGAILGGAVSAGTLQATATDTFYGPGAEPFYGSDTLVFFDAGTYSDMSYTWQVRPTAAGTVLMDQTITANALTVQYQQDSQASFYGTVTDYFYGADAALFYESASVYAVWPGSLAISATETLTFRISTAGGSTQGIVSVATVKLDVPDVIESFNNLVTSAGGTRLPITGTYRTIENVQVTVQADGNNGIAATIEDKSATLGPLIKVRDAAGNAVVGLIDATIQGY